MMLFGSRASLLLCTALAALGFPAAARAERPNIDKVVVSRNDDGIISFRIAFANAVTVSLDDQLQVAIDADRNSGTGVDGLEYSLDFSFGEPALLTAVNGEPVESHPSTLRVSHQTDPQGYGFSDLRIDFSLPASLIGDPRRFDFYVFIKTDEGDLDEAPSHVLFSAGSSPWTYPKDEGEMGTTYPQETYVDGSDITLRERPEIVIAVIAAIVFGVGGFVAMVGWSIQRLRQRSASEPSEPT